MSTATNRVEFEPTAVRSEGGTIFLERTDGVTFGFPANRFKRPEAANEE